MRYTLRQEVEKFRHEVTTKDRMNFTVRYRDGFSRGVEGIGRQETS